MGCSRGGHVAQLQWTRTPCIPWILCFETRRFGKAKEKGNCLYILCGDDKTVQVVLRTIISVNQLRIYGAVADMCDEMACRMSDCSERTGELVDQNNPETTVISTELMTTNKSQTDENVQGNLLHSYEQKVENLPDHLQLVDQSTHAKFGNVLRGFRAIALLSAF